MQLLLDYGCHASAKVSMASGLEEASDELMITLPCLTLPFVDVVSRVCINPQTAVLRPLQMSKASKVFGLIAFSSGLHPDF